MLTASPGCREASGSLAGPGAQHTRANPSRLFLRRRQRANETTVVFGEADAKMNFPWSMARMR